MLLSGSKVICATLSFQQVITDFRMNLGTSGSLAGLCSAMTALMASASAVGSSYGPAVGEAGSAGDVIASDANGVDEFRELWPSPPLPPVLRALATGGEVRSSGQGSVGGIAWSESSANGEARALQIKQ